MRKLTLIGLVILLAGQATAATTLKLATQLPDGTAWMKAFREAGDQIEAQTEGRVQLKFYPGGVMGNDATVMRKIRIGQLHGAALTGGEFARVVPDMKLYSLPFLFRSEEEVEYVRARMDPILREEANAEGFELAGLSGGGFANLYSRSEFSSLQDLQSLKMWLPADDEAASIAFELAGLSPVQLPMSDIYTSLQTGLIDSVASTPTGVIAFQWHTRIKYMSDVPISYLMGTFALSSKALRGLSDADREVVIDTIDELFSSLTSNNKEDNGKARQALEDMGIETIKLSEQDRAKLFAVGEETVTRLKASGGFKHLDQVLSLLAEYRQQE